MFKDYMTIKEIADKRGCKRIAAFIWVKKNVEEKDKMKVGKTWLVRKTALVPYLETAT